MNHLLRKHTFFFWQEKIRKAKYMDELNEIGNSIERQIRLRIPTAVDIDLPEVTIIALWNSFKEKRKKFSSELPFQKYVSQMGL